MASIKKRGDVWRARYRDAAGKEHSRNFKRKMDGQRWLDEVTASIVTGAYVAPTAGRITLAAYFEAWKTRQLWTIGTERAMSLAVRSCTFKDVELGQIEASHVEGWVKRMVTGGLAPGTIRTRVNNVGSVLRGAVRDRRISADPSKGVTLPRVRAQEHSMAIPSPEDVGRLLRAAEPWFAPFIALCAFAGLRLGEAAAVQLGDVDFLRRSLGVRRQVQRGDGGAVELTLPKYGSERVVYLPDGLLGLLSRHVSEVGVYGEPEWLFHGSNGNPPHQNTVGYWWRKTIAQAGVSPIRLHDLRHFYASGLIASGCDVVTVQRALGHKKATVTLNTYAHLWPTAEDRTRNAAGALLASALTTPAGALRAGEA